MKIEYQLAGRYKIEAVNSKTGERRTLANWFDNIITDIGMERMGVGAFIGRCHVGSGSAAPAVTDTGLQAPIAESNTQLGVLINGASSSAPFYGFTRVTYRFAAGAASGNLSEVSVGWAAGNSSAFSRALIKEEGSPVTITVLPDDYLDVTYEFRCYAPENDISFQAVIAGITHNCVARAAYANQGFYWSPAPFQAVATNSVSAYAGDIGVNTASPSGASSVGSFTNIAYSSSSRSRSSMIEWPLAAGNFVGGIKSVVVGSSIGTFQCNFTPTIAKPMDNTKSLRINAFVTWSRKVL